MTSYFEGALYIPGPTASTASAVATIRQSVCRRDGSSLPIIQFQRVRCVSCMLEGSDYLNACKGGRVHASGA